MKLMIDDLDKVSLDYLKKLQAVEGDMEIARRVVNNVPSAVNYFMGEFSKPFLDYIGKNIMKNEGEYIDGALCFYPSVSGDYYEFIGAQFVDRTPTWYKVSLYRGRMNDGYKTARLYTYINTITVRHFLKLKKKSDKDTLVYIDDMPEPMSMSVLKDYSGFDEISFDEEDPRFKELDAAWQKLPERYRLILKYLVIEDKDPLEIFDEMIKHVRATMPPEQYTRKQKQDAMSLLKRYAKRRLRELIVEQRNNNR